MNGFVIQYDKSRFPKRPKRPDGTFGCRGCGGDIPPKRKAWCSRACAHRYDPGLVINQVKQRDKGICQMCGFDCFAAKREWMTRRWDNPRPKRPPRAEYDHIVPFSEGGLTVIENMRTLCHDCHLKVTLEWRKQRRIKQVPPLDPQSPYEGQV